MRDDEDPAAGVARGELGHTRNDACGHALVGLAVVPACVSVEPPAVGGRKARSDLFARQSGPGADVDLAERPDPVERQSVALGDGRGRDRKSTRLNSSHTVISYAVFCLKKKKNLLVDHDVKKNNRNVITHK